MVAGSETLPSLPGRRAQPIPPARTRAAAAPAAYVNDAPVLLTRGTCTPGATAAVEESLARAASERPDFWSVVGQIELRVLVAVAGHRLAGESASLIAEFDDLKARVPARTMWDSVYAEARFTIEPYGAVADPAERRAAEALLDALKAMAAG